MPTPEQALAAAARPVPRAAGPASVRRALVVGGGGALGAAVVEATLGAGGFASVGVVVARPLQPGVSGLQPVPDHDRAWRDFGADTALLVFDRERHANGRDDAFLLPQPDDLASLAARLRDAGVTTLVVVVPHAPGQLPQALKAGLATLDEGRVAALGFARLVFMRPAQRAGARGDRAAAPARLARWMLSQLNWLVPTREQPVRGRTVARVAARIALRLPHGAAGTRVLAPEWLGAAAQRPDDDGIVDAWLAGASEPPRLASAADALAWRRRRPRAQRPR